MRQRLTWKNAENNDVYTMNQTRVDPGQSYQDSEDTPSGWAEDPDMSTPWKSEKRDEVGKAASVKKMAAYKAYMEKKASKCLVIAEALLPGASDADIQAQATDLMDLPDQTVLATLARIRRAEEILLKAEEEALKMMEVPEDDKDSENKDAAAVAEDVKDETPITPTVVGAEADPKDVPPMVEPPADAVPAEKESADESCDEEDPSEDAMVTSEEDPSEEDPMMMESADDDAGDFDVDFDDSDADEDDDSMAPTADQEAKLAMIFGTDLPGTKKASAKATVKTASKGVKKLGSVRTASVNTDKVDLNSLWMNRPDCHDVSGNF